MQFMRYAQYSYSLSLKKEFINLTSNCTNAKFLLIFKDYI